MPLSFLQYTVYVLVLLTFHVGVGDGRWRKTAEETLKYDIKLYRKLNEKINQELLTLYDEYPDDDYYGDEISYIKEQTKHNIEVDTKKTLNEYEISTNNKTDINLQNINKTVAISGHNEYFNHSVYKWPKFEDILVAMGKRYDWKNDRWIKIKKKLENEDKNEVNVKKSSVSFAEKHNFIYKIVKLNRAKSKRNIVIAVTAVR